MLKQDSKFPKGQAYKILAVVCSVAVTAAIGYLIVWAGNLNPPGSPADTMKTLEGIYYELDKDAPATSSWGLDPSAAPTSTMYTLQEIYDKTPKFHSDPGNASTSDVFINKTFYKDSATKLTGTLERAGYSTGTISSTYANGQTDRFVVDQSGASGAGITSAGDIATNKYAWSNGTWYGPGTASGGAGLTKTGQTTSYASSQTCGDGGTGGCDDGYYQAGQALSYTDNGDGTITDNNTGLMWKRCSEPDTQTSGCTGTHSVYTWQDAINQCEGLTYAGYTDWRLPNIKELFSISRLEPGTAPYIDHTAFPGTLSSSYWSATTYPEGTASALYVYFGGGFMNTHGKTDNDYVRCVRGQ